MVVISWRDHELDTHGLVLRRSPVHHYPPGAVELPSWHRWTPTRRGGKRESPKGQPA